MSAEVDACLIEWPQWNFGLDQAPELLQKLGNETTNSSFLLDANGRKLVLRLHQSNPLFSCDRQQEYTIQLLASDSGLSPKVLYQHPQHRYRLSEFIAGNPGRENDTGFAGLLCEQVQQYQQLSIALTPFSYSQCLQQYFEHWQDIPGGSSNTTAVQEKHQQMLALTRQYEKAYGSARCLCHHDLNIDNMVIAPGGAIYLLDWEFAGAGIASMDFAGLAVELDVDINDMSIMAGCDKNELELAASIYRYLCELYQLALAGK